jgi:PhzF family phenazine biosynthesis protein
MSSRRFFDSDDMEERMDTSGVQRIAAFADGGQGGNPPGLAHAGNDHLVLPLASRARLAHLAYDLAAGRALMAAHGLVTIVLAWAEEAARFHARNAFAIGGVLEDPATGAGTAALAGYLRDLGWPHGGRITVVQGEDMGRRSLLTAGIPDAPGSAIRVAGTARFMADDEH